MHTTAIDYGPWQKSQSKALKTSTCMHLPTSIFVYFETCTEKCECPWRSIVNCEIHCSSKFCKVWNFHLQDCSYYQNMTFNNELFQDKVWNYTKPHRITKAFQVLVQNHNCSMAWGCGGSLKSLQRWHVWNDLLNWNFPLHYGMAKWLGHWTWNLVS